MIQDALRRSCSTKHGQESSGILLQGKNPSVAQGYGAFENCVHVLHKKKNTMLYKIPIYMCIPNLKCMLLILTLLPIETVPYTYLKLKYTIINRNSL